MPISRHHIAIKGDECQCGRRKSIIHCPFCGSTQTRTYVNPRFHKHMNGEVKEVTGLHHCNACAKNFTPEEREWCNATPIGAADAARKLQMLAEAENSPNQDEHTAQLTARQLLDALKQRGTTTTPEVKALERMTEDDPELIRIVQQLREAFIIESRAFEADGQTHPETLDNYIDRRLRDDFGRTRQKE